jgi:hypothetical protein
MYAFDTMMLMPKSNRKSIIKTIKILTLASLFIILGFKLDNAQKELQIAKSNGIQINNLLYGKNKTPGLSCGILSNSKAEELLGVDLNRSFIQGPDNLVSASNPYNNVFWTDSCRYLSPNDSSKYVELFINSYQTKADAEKAYIKIFPKVNDNVEIEPNTVGERLVYDSGVYYLLDGSRIIRVSANNGSASNLEQFSRSVFDSLIEDLRF